jgi:hypothetical protein
MPLTCTQSRHPARRRRAGRRGDRAGRRHGHWQDDGERAALARVPLELHSQRAGGQAALETVVRACAGRGATAVVLDALAGVDGPRLTSALAAAGVPEVASVPRGPHKAGVAETCGAGG